jgi:hypothetical protein
MAFALDTQAHIPTTASATSTATTLSIGYTCGAYDGALIVFPIWSGTNARTGGSPTYAGSPLTEVLTQKTVTETSIEAWYMLSPPSGSYTLSVPNAGGLTMWVDIASAKSTSASLTFAVDSTSSSATTAANPGVTITTVAAPTMIWVGIGTGDNTWLPTGLSGSATYNDDIGTYGGGVQYAVKETTGAQRISWTDATSDDYNILAVAFKEVARNFSSSVTNDATQAQTAENITLIYNAPPATLVANNSQQAQTSDNVTLSAHYTLSNVQDAVQLQTAENTVVTFHNLLVVGDASQLQTSDNTVLSAHYTLTVNDASQLQNADNTVLSAHYILTSVQDATQAQTAENTVITVYYTVITQDSTQAQTSESVILSAHYSLTVQDATQIQTSDNVTVTYNSGTVTLSVNNATQTQTSTHIFSYKGILANYKHETGNFSEYGGANTNGGNLTVSSNAALAGTGFGLSFNIVDTNSETAWSYITPTNTTGKIEVRIHVDPNSLNMADLSNCFLVYGNTDDWALPYGILLDYTSGSYNIYAVTCRDSGGTTGTSKYNITDEPHCVEIRVLRATDSTSSDGSITLWIDEILKETVSNIDNYDSFDNLYYVATGYGYNYGTVSGIYYVDEIVIRDDGYYIGPNIYTPTQNTTQTQTSENVSLTQHYVITVNNVSQAQTSDTISLNAHYSITVSDAVQAQIADSVFLAAFYVLIMNNATQLHTSENIILSSGEIGLTKQMMHYIRLRSR